MGKVRILLLALSSILYVTGCQEKDDDTKDLERMVLLEEEEEESDWEIGQALDSKEASEDIFSIPQEIIIHESPEKETVAQRDPSATR
jgi:hypothetical protein